jgi:hypothetical protein
MNILLLYVLGFVIMSCSSLPKESILAQMEDRDRPEWASLEKAITSKDGKLLIVGFSELDADAKISAGYRMADNAARNELSKIINNQFSSIFQNLEEGVTDDGNLSRSYASEVSKTALRELRITKRYWEKVQSFDRDGEKTYRLRIYTLAEIPEAQYKKLIRERLASEKIDPAVKKQVLNHFESEIQSFQSR